MDELEQELAEKIKEIKPVDQKAIEIAKKRWDSIAHPLHLFSPYPDCNNRRGTKTLRRRHLARWLPIHAGRTASVCAPDAALPHGTAGKGR